MNTYDLAVIGFGKAGKTLAATMAKQGKKVALIEKSEQMYGGTCINIACIPTKTLEHFSRKTPKEANFSEKQAHYKKSIEEKRNLVAFLRQKNYEKMLAAGVEVIQGEARFTSPHSLEVKNAKGETILVEAEKFLINTGASTVMLSIPGLEASKKVYSSDTIMELETLPKRLVIIGAGYIGLEFASYYNHFGSQVSVVQPTDDFLPREDQEVAAQVKQDLLKRGIEIWDLSTVVSGKEVGDELHLQVKTADGEKTLVADALLVAIGRKPNTQALDLEKAGVEVAGNGAVVVNEHLQSSQSHIWAAGDAKGGLQFTYISLDDFRIIRASMTGEDTRTTENRGLIPYSLFIDPPFSRVGLTEAEAKQAGHEVKVFKLPAAAIPKARILEQTRGLLKVVTDAKTGEILGGHLYAAEAHELIHIIKFAMMGKLTITDLKNTIYAHPTMAEALNDLVA